MLLQYRESYSLTLCGAIFAAGVLFPWVVKYVFRQLVISIVGSRPERRYDDGSRIYSLKHDVLNIKIPEIEMWMNMGYWKDQYKPRDFSHASKSLLHQILITAGIISGSDDVSKSLKHVGVESPNIHIVDVGFGCGDQAIELLSLETLKSYIGVTLDKKQFTFAQQRLEARQLLTNELSVPDQHEKSAVIRQVFNADAAQPKLWDVKLKEAIAATCLHDTRAEHTHVWVLGLDVLYHFSPSRLPLFAYAHGELRASIMAFDLLLPDHSEKRLTTLQTSLLRMVASVTSTPFANFLTPDEYRRQLITAGYSKEDIEIRDVSANVFGPLVEFMTWQDNQLKHFGFGIGVFHAARWVFGWWARSGIVRGCIVVARRKRD